MRFSSPNPADSRLPCQGQGAAAGDAEGQPRRSHTTSGTSFLPAPAAHATFPFWAREARLVRGVSAALKVRGGRGSATGGAGAPRSPGHAARPPARPARPARPVPVPLPGEGGDGEGGGVSPEGFCPAQRHGHQRREPARRQPPAPGRGAGGAGSAAPAPALSLRSLQPP